MDLDPTPRRTRRRPTRFQNALLSRHGVDDLDIVLPLREQPPEPTDLQFGDDHIELVNSAIEGDLFVALWHNRDTGANPSWRQECVYELQRRRQVDSDLR